MGKSLMQTIKAGHPGGQVSLAQAATGIPSVSVPPGSPRRGMGMDLLNFGGTPLKFHDEANDVRHTFVLAPTRHGMTFNPMAHIGADPDDCLRMTQLAACCTLNQDAYSLARRIAIEVAEVASESGGPTVRDLVSAWRAEPNLIHFADAVANAMLPA